MRPTSEEIIASLLWTFENLVAPEVESAYARSLTLTMANLMRHLALRVGAEGESLWEDNRELRELLGHVRRFAATAADPPLALLAGDLERTLAQSTIGPGTYPSVGRLQDEAVALRAALTAALRVLQAARGRYGSVPGYGEIRAAIRAYHGRRLDREARMIEPAFVGDRR